MLIGFVIWVVFQSTLSMRRATRTTTLLFERAKIFQSTLSMRRATPNERLADLQVIVFQSTLSMRRATWQGQRR